MSKLYWWIQKSINNNCCNKQFDGVEEQSAVFQEFEPTISKQGFTWKKVIDLDAYEELREENEKLKEQNKIMRESLEFYANKFSYRTNSGKVGITPLTDGQDCEIIDGHPTGGKLARKTLEELK